MATGLKTLFETELTDTVNYSATDDRQGDKDGVGRLRWDEDGNVYRWVQNWHTVALAEGNIVTHTYSDAANALERVRDNLTADLGFMAGVVMATASVTKDTDGSTGDGGYCWVQCHGYNATAAVRPDTNSTPAAGETMIGLTAQLALNAPGVAMGSAPLHIRNCMVVEAVSQNASATAGTIAATKVWVNCL